MTMDDFRVNSYAYKTISEIGYRNSAGVYDVNYSGILSRLIQEAGRFCESFASDLFIDWQAVLRFIERAEEGDSKSYLFGFRQSGVDHDAFIFSYYEEAKAYASYRYRSMWRLDIECVADSIEMTLGRVF